MLWIATSFFLMLVSSRLGLGTFHSPGPGLMPFILGVLLLIVSGYLFVKWLARPLRRNEDINEKGDRVGSRKIVILLSFLLGYALLLEKLGYPITTFLFLTFLFRFMGAKWILTLLTSVLTVLLTYLIFTSLGVRFPMGILVRLGVF